MYKRTNALTRAKYYLVRNFMAGVHLSDMANAFWPYPVPEPRFNAVYYFIAYVRYRGRILVTGTYYTVPYMGHNICNMGHRASCKP